MGTDTNAVAVGTKVGNARWIIAAICFLAYLVAFFDRANVSVLIANTGFTEAFGISGDKSAQGMLLTAFLLCYGLSCFFCGPLCETLWTQKSAGLWYYFLGRLNGSHGVNFLLPHAGTVSSSFGARRGRPRAERLAVGSNVVPGSRKGQSQWNMV